MKFLSKPVEIEAVQWLGTNKQELLAFTDAESSMTVFNGDYPNLVLWIQKPGVWTTLNTGDWIIKEPDGGGFYPCVPNIFNARYAPKPEDN